MNSDWNRTGARAAWINGIAYLVAAILFSLVAFGITTPAEPEFVEDDIAANVGAQLQFDEALFPQTSASNLIFALGFLALAPIGLALRESTGRGKNGQLLSMSFLLAAIFGALGQLITIGVSQAVFQRRPFESGDRLISLDIIRGIFDGPLTWLATGFFLFAGFGVWYASKLAREGHLSKGWGYLSVLVAVLYFSGVVLQIAIAYLPSETEFTGRLLFSADTAESIFQFLVLIGGGVLAPIWAIWLATQFPKIGVRQTSQP